MTEYSERMESFMKGKQDVEVIQAEMKENLSYLKVLTKPKQSFAKLTSPYFIIWGLIWVLAFSFMELGVSKVTIYTWLGLTLLGWIFTIVIFTNQRNKSPLPLFFRQQLKMVWIAVFFLAIVLAFLISTELLVLSLHSFALYIFLSTSLMYVFLGIVLTKELFYMGLWLGVLGAFTYQFFLEHIFMIFSLVGGGCLIITGILMKYKGNKDE